jgi:hypothetical protein
MRLEVHFTQEASQGVRRDGVNDAPLGRLSGECRIGPMGQGLTAVARRLAGQRDQLADLLRRKCRRSFRAWGSQVSAIPRSDTETSVTPNTNAKASSVGAQRGSMSANRRGGLRIMKGNNSGQTARRASLW